MKNILAILLLLVFSNISFAQVGKETDLWSWSPEGEHHASLVQISYKDSLGCGVVFRIDKTTPNGSGFNGWVLTAAHVVSDLGASGGLTRASGGVGIQFQNKRKAKDCKIVAFDSEHDIAILWTWVPEDAAVAQIAVEPIIRGDRVEFVGLGGGTEPSDPIRHFYGFSSYPTTEDVIYADTCLLPGDSGGPIFNREKELVGVISGGWFHFGDQIKLPDCEGGMCAVWPATGCNTGPMNTLMESLNK